MKFLIIGDQHFRFQLPYSAAFDDGRRGEWLDVIKKIHESSVDCDAIILLGDNLNTRHNHSSVNRDFIKFLRGFGEKNIYIISGNHELYGSETAIDFIKAIETTKWHIITKPTHKLLDGGIKASFLPYTTPGLLEVSDVHEANKKIEETFLCEGGDILFHHHAVSGTKINGTTTDFLNEIVLRKEYIESKYGLIFGGHIHTGQEISTKTYVTGNIFSSEIGDHEKHIFTLDTKKNNEIKKIQLPVRGIYSVDSDLQKIDAIPKNSIVKFILRDKSLDIDTIKEKLSSFDANIVITQYDNGRKKIDIDESDSFDFSVDSLLKLYCETKDLSYSELKRVFDLI